MRTPTPPPPDCVITVTFTYKNGCSTRTQTLKNWNMIGFLKVIYKILLDRWQFLFYDGVVRGRGREKSRKRLQHAPPFWLGYLWATILRLAEGVLNGRD